MHDRCYAEHGFVGIHTRRLNSASEIEGTTALATAKEESAAIDRLSGERDLRVHVVGDCKTNTTAKIVAYEAKRGTRAYTYTHAWKRVDVASWQGANVLASCDSIEDVPQAKKRGYATALVALKGTDLFKQFASGHKAGRVNGLKLIPCPYQVSPKKPTCVKCRLCFDAKRLRKMDATILFLEHN